MSAASTASAPAECQWLVPAAIVAAAAAAKPFVAYNTAAGPADAAVSLDCNKHRSLASLATGWPRTIQAAGP